MKKELAEISPQEKIETPAPSVAINGQYIKELSFDNPHAPVSFSPLKDQPKIEIAINFETKAVVDQVGVYEVTLYIKAKATSAETNLFNIKLAYAGLFTVANIREEQQEALLLIHCPTLLFPYARRVISDITRDSGFQPLMLEHMDFAALYQQRRVQKEAEENEVLH